MDEKLVFRRARPADAARIMEIIRQAQAQMRALGSLQWQDGYPAAADIGHDIACGYGWVFEKPEAEKSTDARGTDGTGAAGFRAVTAAAGKTTGTEAAGKTGVSGADETAAAAEEAEEAEKAGEAGGRGETEPAKAAAAQGNVIAYGAVVFDGEPAYDAIEGAWLTDGEYVVLHRMAGSMRVDTNFDNRYMLRMLGRLGFVYCGKVRYRSGERLAFEKTLGT